MKIRNWSIFAVALILVVSFVEIDLEGGVLPKPKKRKKPKKPKISQTELDPLRHAKVFKDATTKIGPNVVIAFDRSPRMLQDWTGLYYDPGIYDKDKDASTRAAAAQLNVNAAARYYRRIYKNLNRKVSGKASTFQAETIEAIDETEEDYLTFGSISRLGLARDGLAQAVEENLWYVRFGLVGSRQGDQSDNADWPNTGAQSPVSLSGSQKGLTGDNGNKTWKVTVPLSKNANVDAKAEAGDLLVKTGEADSSSKTLQILESEAYHDTGIKPFGYDYDLFDDSPLTNLLTDTKAEVERVLDADTDLCRPCRNTVVILVAGGGDGGKSIGRPTPPGSVAAQFKAITVKGVTRRVPIFVIALGPTGAEQVELKDVAANSGGEYYEALDGNDVALIASRAIQAAHMQPTDLDTGVYTENQTVSPVVGTVDLANAKDYAGAALPNSLILRGGTVIPQNNNVLFTSGYLLPGFAGSIRAFRTFKPEADATADFGYKFVKDGTPLWRAHVPGADGGPGDKDRECAAAADGSSRPASGSDLAISRKSGGGGGSGIGMCGIDLTNPGGGVPDDRNLFTYLPSTGVMVALTAANAAALRPYLQVDTDADAADLIEFIRAQPIGAVMTSTPALRNPPSATNITDPDYQTFMSGRRSRRALLFVGGNAGLLHAIDARTGVEVWGYVPFNQLPKLQTLRDGQGVTYFEYFVDSSPKISDVKVGGAWRTYLFFGQGAGGTFYQALDVSDAGNTLDPKEDNEGAVVAAFTNANVIPYAWSFPNYSKFDYTISTPAMPYGDLGASATAVEKSVGETWSAPAIGQLGDASSPYSLIVGSGYLSLETEKQTNRAYAKAGHTLYVLDAGTGAVRSSYDVGDDTGKNNLKNSLHADPTTVGPPNSRFIDKVYIGDTEGDMWRFAVASDGQLSAPLKIYDAEKEHPIFMSASVVSGAGNDNYVFFATGSDALSHLKKIQKFVLVGVHDDGRTSMCRKGDATCERFVIPLEKADGKGGDERPTASPAAAGGVIFFTTTVDFPKLPCDQQLSSLFAMTLTGGAAYDSTGDGTVTAGDSIVIKEPLGRATAPFVADNHLYFGTEGNIEILGDPEGFNNGFGLSAARMLTWREVR